MAVLSVSSVFLLQAEDGIRDLVRSRGLGDVYKRQASASPLTLEPSRIPTTSPAAQGWEWPTVNPGPSSSMKEEPIATRAWPVWAMAPPTALACSSISPEQTATRAQQEPHRPLHPAVGTHGRSARPAVCSKIAESSPSPTPSSCLFERLPGHLQTCP